MSAALAGLSTGQILGIGAAQTGAGLAQTAAQYFAQKALQEDAQDFNSYEAQLSREFTSRENSIARQFSLDYDASKYQRQVADMKAAGINPALIMGTTSTTTPLSGSSTPSQGASSSVGVAYGSNFSSILSSAINAGLARSLKNDNFRSTMLGNTAQALSNINVNIGSKDPKWLKDYVENFESGVDYL